MWRLAAVALAELVLGGLIVLGIGLALLAGS